MSKPLSLLLVGVLVVVALGVPTVAFAQEAEEATHPLLRFLFAWAPFILIIGLWVYFMRGLGGRRLGSQYERSMLHMEKLENQTNEVLETLKRIETLLRDRS